MISTKSHSDAGGDPLLPEGDDWLRAGLRSASHVIYETLTAVKAAVETYRQAPAEQPPLQEACVHLRQLHGALVMLEFDQGAQLITESEYIVRGLLQGDERIAEACNLLLRAIHELQATLEPLDTHLRPLLGLEAVIEELSDFVSGQRDLFYPLTDPRSPVPELEFEVLRAGERHGQVGEHGQVPDAETGEYVAQIKDRLKEVVQVMPQWWEDLHDAQLLDSLRQSFHVIADRARSLNLAELADLAELLERLVAKVNDDMISMTSQMMYGVIEQGVLKLGVLFLQYCRPHDPPQGGAERARLASALADMQLLTNEVASLASDTRLASAHPIHHEGLELRDSAISVGAERTAGGDGGASWDEVDGFNKVEDLLIEANLLHSQLLPRINMMKHQQQHIQTQLAYLQRSAGDAPAPVNQTADALGEDGIAEKVVAMMNANQLLAKLISEAEACLLKYRQATHEVQRVIFGGVARASRGELPAV